MANIFEIVLYVNKQCLLHEKKYSSKAYDKESLSNNEKHCGFDTLRLRRMEYV